MHAKLRIGALISGGGTNLQAVIDACNDGRIDGRLVFVGSDNPAAGGLDRAQRAAVPTFVVDYRAVIQRYRAAPREVPVPANADLQALMQRQALLPDHTPVQRLETFIRTRVAAEAALLAAMEDFPFDLLILAGFMRNLTPYFIDHVNTDPQHPRIMNIHPALLPAFPGIDGYGDTYRYGCKVGGCTVHFVDYGEDSGPIIGQRAFAIAPGDDLDRIRQKGLEHEWRLYPECIQLFAANRLRVVNKEFKLTNGKVFKRRVVEIGD